MKLSEKGSLSQESYGIAFCALKEALGNCLSVNTFNQSLVEAVTLLTNGLICIEEHNQRSMSKMNKIKNPMKKRKVNSEHEVINVGTQDSLQQMEKLNSRLVTLDGYYNI